MPFGNHFEKWRPFCMEKIGRISAVLQKGTIVLDLMDLLGPIGGPAFSSQTPSLVAFGV